MMMIYELKVKWTDSHFPLYFTFQLLFGFFFIFFIEFMGMCELEGG